MPQYAQIDSVTRRVHTVTYQSSGVCDGTIIEISTSNPDPLGAYYVGNVFYHVVASANKTTLLANGADVVEISITTPPSFSAIVIYNATTGGVVATLDVTNGSASFQLISEVVGEIALRAGDISPAKTNELTIRAI